MKTEQGFQLGNRLRERVVVGSRAFLTKTAETHIVGDPYESYIFLFWLNDSSVNSQNQCYNKMFREALVGRNYNWIRLEKPVSEYFCVRTRLQMACRGFIMLEQILMAN